MKKETTKQAKAEVKVKKTKVKVSKETKEFLDPVIPVQTPEEELKQEQELVKNKIDELLDNANWFEKIMWSILAILLLISLACLFPFLWLGEKIHKWIKNLKAKRQSK